MSEQDTILETRNLTKEFKGFTAVSDVNLQVRRGSIHALIGPNGAGKTTCFNLLTKFLEPTTGTIVFNGIDITREKPAQIARRGVIRSFQISAVFPHLTVMENVRIGLQRQLGTAYQFWRSERSLDVLNDRAIELNEWQWSRASFDRLDRNNDGRLSRAEFVSAGPLGSTTGTTRTPLTVSSQDRWTDTGIYLEPGQTVTFRATGTIQMSEDGSDIADPQGARSGRRAPNAPLRDAPAGALIGRVGNGTPAVLGANGEMRVTRAGRLYLSVNDDELSDNRGEYRVVVTVR